ncbi:hypothetical protein RchiOBHm_Chr3g0494541 [Rosa chinensis]|uniref:Uncharacterized protein n=1 Tax=Rosa chinensis TaxID=74649 RepID=A0A2P6RH01_ROSCH|nr:hypothetical protein RchiOBHm_Chr3g0494541 [Rosa chinensis]
MVIGNQFCEGKEVLIGSLLEICDMRSVLIDLQDFWAANFWGGYVKFSIESLSNLVCTCPLLIPRWNPGAVSGGEPRSEHGLNDGGGVAGLVVLGGGDDKEAEDINWNI